MGSLTIAQKKEGIEGIRQLGHREYVGGMWEKIGRLQFDYLLKQGLKKEDVLVDIGCGSLRGGVHFINYLNEGNYLGIDKEKAIIDMGIEKELGFEFYGKMKPEFVISDSFEFKKFTKTPTFAIAQSLFTHLNVQDITKCLDGLRHFAEKGIKFYATFFEGNALKIQKESHSHKLFYYSYEDFCEIAEKTNWEIEYIGEWEHPREQKLLFFTY